MKVNIKLTDKNHHIWDAVYDAEGKSAIGNNIKEGWTMRSIPEGWHPKLGRKIIKHKGRDYKLMKGKE